MSSQRESASVKRAKDILRGQTAQLTELASLVETLKREKAFGYARKLLQRACFRPELSQQPKLRTWFIQQHALCTYRDPDLPVESKFDRALTILKQLGDLRTLEQLGDMSTSDKQETLGLAGAIHKYKWEAYGQKQYLEHALAFYLRGYQLGIASDYGYTAINAAFVLDQLAYLARKEGEETGIASDLVAMRQQHAACIREEIITIVPPLAEQPGQERLKTNWWFFSTVAEAYFGLGRIDKTKYDYARSWLKQGRNTTEVSDWELESTARQLAALAQIQASESASGATLKNSPAWEVIRDFLGAEYAAGLQGIFLGKVGLALSGGGFRASLFHIGVLARLAELDMLRHVEVLSCVSGGSIIGAHYYLELRKRLQEKQDSKIEKTDYIDIVQKVQRDFLAGVQCNIRMRLLADFYANLKMILAPNSYSRSMRIGELYEEEIFSKVEDGNGAQPRYMDDLLVRPEGESELFSPKSDNWRRAAKVPMLILNATTLNTGHNWQFTATWMGEPPSAIETEIDSNERLRRMYYDEAPEGYHKIRLGHAVAASACVPGIFDPIVFPDLYPDRTVRLVDGGVHDNQGIASLLEQGCSVLLVSDASGQMESQAKPSASLLGPPLRTNTILQARVRGAQYYDLDSRRRSSLLRNLMFVHLKKDLSSTPVNWVQCDDPPDAVDTTSLAESQGVFTSYGIRKDVQERLAAIRTDLDSFSEVEAYALMTSGYRMTEYEFLQSLPHFPTPTQPCSHWQFLDIEETMKQRDGATVLNRFLAVSSELFLKVWRLAPAAVQTAAMATLGVLAVGFIYACFHWASVPLLTLGMIGSALVALIGGVIVSRKVIQVVRFRETLEHIGLGVALSAFVCLPAKLHLRFFDPKYLQFGQLAALLKGGGSPSPRPSEPVTKSAPTSS